MAAAEVGDDPEIKWGKKTGTGGKGKKVQFYESFVYDDVEYVKFDNVYLFKTGESEPYVGKLLKMWETGDKQKKAKVLWFFQREEVSNFIGNGEDVLENEVFLASGEALGLANINPLEAIAGKCNVVCISKDSRNRQPTDAEIKNADFVFRRTFDVDCCKIKDEIVEKIAGTDVNLLLNRENSTTPLILDSGTKEVDVNAEQNALTIPKHLETLKTNGNCTSTPANEAPALNVLSAKPESEECMGTEKTIVSGKKVSSNSKVESKRRKDKDGKPLVKQAENEGKGKRAKESDELEVNRQSKKTKLTSEKVDKVKNAVQEPRLSPDANAQETLALNASDIDYKNELRRSDASPNTMGGPIKTLKANDKRKLSKGKRKVSSELDDEDPKIEEQELVDKTKWFRDRSWNDELKYSHEQGKLVLLQNLEPSWTSDEVKVLIAQIFNEKCNLKMIQKTAYSSPHSGQAFVAFHTKDAARRVLKRLEDNILLLSNGRPLIASPGTPCFPEKKTTICGHIAIEKRKYKMPREEKDAVSTSHCAQHNTLEYEMATEWALRQRKSELQFEILYNKQRKEMKTNVAKLKGQFKSKK